MDFIFYHKIKLVDDITTVNSALSNKADSTYFRDNHVLANAQTLIWKNIDGSQKPVRIYYSAQSTIQYKLNGALTTATMNAGFNNVFVSDGETFQVTAALSSLNIWFGLVDLSWFKQVI